MAETTPFHDLLQWVRARDPAAAREIVERYGPHLRTVARHELRDARLRRLVDSEDLCQSVAAAFFSRAEAGQFDLETPEQFLALLAAMARNRVRYHAERERTAKRDQRRSVPLDSAVHAAATGPSPSSAASARELLAAFLERLSDGDRRIADLRAEGRTWEEIGIRLETGAEAARKRFERACDRVARELGIGGGST